MPTVYPHPALVTPTTLKTGWPVGVPYSKTLATGASFAVAADEEAEMLTSAFALNTGAGADPKSLSLKSYLKAEILADAPALYYEMAEPNGTKSTRDSTTIDSSGNARHGLYQTIVAPTPWVNVAGGTRDGAGAAGINANWGNAPYVSVPYASYNPYALGVDRTFEVMAKLIPSPGAGQMLWASLHTSDGFPYFNAQPDATNITFGWAPHGNAGGNVAWAAASHASYNWIASGWNHVAMTYAGASTRNSSLYINGQFISTLTPTVDVAVPTYGMIWGLWYPNSAVWPLYNGSAIQHAAVYHSLLSAARIKAHADAAALVV